MRLRLFFLRRVGGQAGRCGLASEARSGGSVRPDDVFLTDRGDARSVAGMTCRILHL